MRSIHSASRLASVTMATITSHTPAYGSKPGRRSNHGRSLHNATPMTIAIHSTNTMPTL
jgi:hypothetical protein